MEVTDRSAKLWNYLPDDIKGLVQDGEYLLKGSLTPLKNVSDFSYMVFPFAKAYEGFLKHFFLDLNLIKEEEFYGDDIRIGRILNPIFMEKRYSVYSKLKRREGAGEKASKRLWKIWKKGRNQVFHYFPHNFRKLSREEAAEIIYEFISAMEFAVSLLEK